MHKYHGHSNGCFFVCVQPNNPTADSQLPFHLDLNQVSTGFDMHATNNTKSSVACEITDCELINIYSLDLSLVYQAVTTSTTEFNSLN